MCVFVCLFVCLFVSLLARLFCFVGLIMHLRWFGLKGTTSLQKSASHGKTHSTFAQSTQLQKGMCLGIIEKQQFASVYCVIVADLMARAAKPPCSQVAGQPGNVGSRATRQPGSQAAKQLDLSRSCAAQVPRSDTHEAGGARARLASWRGLLTHSHTQTQHAHTRTLTANDCRGRKDVFPRQTQ